MRLAKLDSVFDPRRNSLNAIRLALAVAVIVCHSWPIGFDAAASEPGVAGSSLGAWSVTGFFVVSGYLITASRFSSTGLFDFLWRRFIRIYPAFLAVLLVVAVVFAPLSLLLDPAATWSLRDGVHYVISNIGLRVNEWQVGGTLSHNPNTAWNGSLWTLVYEVGCYVLVGLVVSLVRTKRVTLLVLAAMFVVGEALAIQQIATVGGAQITDGFGAVVQLVPAFLAGALLYLLRDRIPMNSTIGLTSGALVVVGILGGAFPAVAPIPLALFMFWLAVRLPAHSVGSRNDISYGMYIWAFPVQQMLVLMGLGNAPIAIFAVLSIVATVPFAWASWRLIERPALRAKGLPGKVWSHLDNRQIA